MAGYANQHSNTQSNRVGYKSDGRISGYSAGLYATWYQNDANKTGAYVDSWALYNWFDNSVSSDNRSADDYDSRGVTASVEGGYTFEAGTFSGSEGTLNIKLAMGLNASKGKKTAIDKIYPRHFLATAKVLRFPEVQMHEILSDFARMIPAALDNVKTSLPTDFPENVVTAVESNVLRLHGRLSREYGSK